MPYYEIIYETGNKSVAFYEDDAEMERALSEHHRRAINGEPGSPSMTLRSDVPAADNRIGTWVAERVKRVLEYDKHPDDFNLDQVASTDEVEKVVADTLKAAEQDGVVPIHAISAAVRELSSPIVETEHVHDSQYKMEESKEVNLGFLKKVES